MANLSPEQAARLKKTYATAEDLQASSNFKSMTPGAQKIALAAYDIVPKPQTNTSISPNMPKESSISNISNNASTTKAKPTNIDPIALEKSYGGTNYQTDVSTSPNSVSETNGTDVSKQKTTTQETKTNEPSKTDVSATRLAEIQKNLTDYATTQPELFTDINQYKSFFGYDQRAPEQQKVLDSFFNTQQQKILKQKEDQDRYNQLSTMSNTDLMNISDVNDIALINQDPNLAYKYQQAQNNKQMFEFVYGKDYNKTPTPQIDGLDGLPDNLKTEIATTSAELTKLKRTIDNTYDDLVKQAEGTGATESYLRAKAAKINSELTKEYNDKLGNYQILTAEAQAQADAIKADKEDIAQRMQLYELMYGSFSERNATKTSTEGSKTWTDPITGTGYQYNESTGRYDIPIGTTSASGTPITNIQLTQDEEGYVNVPRNVNGYTNNVGVDTNNFGNLTNISGTAGKYKSPNGRTYAVYYTAEEGYNALINDLKAKQTGKSTKANANTTVGELFNIWVSGKKSGMSDKDMALRLRASGLNKNEKIGNVDANKLALGIMAGEGTLDMYKSGGIILGQGTNTQHTNFDAFTKGLFDKFSKDGIIPNAKDLSQIGMNATQFKNKYNEYKSQITEQGTDLNTILSMLSHAARAVVEKNASMGNTAAERDKIKKELSDSGYFNLGLGNDKFLSLKSSDKNALAGVANSYLAIQAVNDLFKQNGKPGAITTRAINILKGLGINAGTGNFNKVKTILGKQLASYIKDISGSAVTDRERAILNQFMPQQSQTDKVYGDNLQMLINELGASVDTFTTDYGFNDAATMYNKLGLKYSDTAGYLQSIGAQNTQTTPQLDWDTYSNQVLNTTAGASNMINRQ